MDDKFRDISSQIASNDTKIERIERDLLEMQMKLPKEFVMREEFASRLSEGTKKMDYLVEQVDAIKNMLMFGREKS
jgi:chromosome condensin MukBEF ATPase and DNA-binding subunit MukB